MNYLIIDPDKGSKHKDFIIIRQCVIIEYYENLPVDQISIGTIVIVLQVTEASDTSEIKVKKNSI